MLVTEKLINKYETECIQITARLQRLRMRLQHATSAAKARRAQAEAQTLIDTLKRRL